MWLVVSVLVIGVIATLLGLTLFICDVIWDATDNSRED